ncbi:hypothetical protein RB596_006229 [Gaeumannomyces avenae]
MARLSLYLLYAAVAVSSTAAAVMPDGTTEPPPIVQAAPGIESVPNTATTVQSVPARPLHGLAAEEMQKRAITQIQFWKERNFRGQYAITTLDPKVCYTFGGPSWTQWDKAIVAVNIASNGPCRFYEGLYCDVNSLGPIEYGRPIEDLGVYGWARRASSIRCD